MAIAFFDLDKTILSRNSGALWVRAELRAGFITWAQAARASLWILRYHAGFADLEDAILESIGSLAGQPEAVIRDRSLRFYDAQVRALVRPGALAALEAHRNAGEPRVLLTSSSNYLSDAAAEQLGLDGVLCNRFEVDGRGHFTGRPLGTLCFGKGKVEAATAYARTKGVALADCVFYTDSASDLPMLEGVGRPVAVNPDPRLRREARRRGWEIVDWGVPALSASVALR